jgi:branched-chain amino acid transport system ATP-binding protein
VLLLDEPAGGLNRMEVQELAAVLRTIREDEQCAIWVVEHNMDFVMGLCGYIYVLHHGALIGEGPPEAVGRMPAVVEAYLGAPYDVS